MILLHRKLPEASKNFSALSVLVVDSGQKCLAKIIQSFLTLVCWFYFNNTESQNTNAHMYV